MPQAWWTDSFSKAISSIGRTLLILQPWDAPAPLARSWCLFEIFSTTQADDPMHAHVQEPASTISESALSWAGLDIALAPSQERSFLDALLNNVTGILLALAKIGVGGLGGGGGSGAALSFGNFSPVETVWGSSSGGGPGGGGDGGGGGGGGGPLSFGSFRADADAQQLGPGGAATVPAAEGPFWKVSEQAVSSGASWELLELASAASGPSAELALLLSALPLDEDESGVAAAVGRAGEAYVTQLLTTLPEYAGARICWHNMLAESGLPYDIDIVCSGGERTFVEVKATTAARNFFDVSFAELEHARRHGERYHIYRVFPGGDDGEPRLAVARICNPLAALTHGDARLLYLTATPV